MPPFLTLDPIAVKAELYGILKFIPRKSDLCQHVTCGFTKQVTRWDWKTNTYAVVQHPGKEVKCSWERYKKCTTQELSTPDVTADSIFAAIQVHVVTTSGYNQVPEASGSMIFLHDLYADKTKDRWFQKGGTANGSIQPNIQVGNSYPKPSELVNLHDVLEGMKKSL